MTPRARSLTFSHAVGAHQTAELLVQGGSLRGLGVCLPEAVGGRHWSCLRGIFFILFLFPLEGYRTGEDQGEGEEESADASAQVGAARERRRGARENVPQFFCG